MNELASGHELKSIQNLLAICTLFEFFEMEEKDSKNLYLTSINCFKGQCNLFLKGEGHYSCLASMGICCSKYNLENLFWSTSSSKEPFTGKQIWDKAQAVKRRLLTWFSLWKNSKNLDSEKNPLSGKNWNDVLEDVRFNIFKKESDPSERYSEKFSPGTDWLAFKVIGPWGYHVFNQPIATIFASSSDLKSKNIRSRKHQRDSSNEFSNEIQVLQSDSKRSFSDSKQSIDEINMINRYSNQKNLDLKVKILQLKLQYGDENARIQALADLEEILQKVKEIE